MDSFNQQGLSIGSFPKCDDEVAQQSHFIKEEEVSIKEEPDDLGLCDGDKLCLKSENIDRSFFGETETIFLSSELRSGAAAPIEVYVKVEDEKEDFVFPSTSKYEEIPDPSTREPQILDPIHIDKLSHTGDLSLPVKEGKSSNLRSGIGVQAATDLARYRKKDHQKTCFSEKRFSCPHCEMRFAFKSNLKRHLLKHSGEKPFACSHCQMRFTRKSSLKTHLLIHSGDKLFACTHCERKFALKQNLKDHLLIHSGERPFACPQCKKRFTQQSALKRHLLTHSGEKPFACSHCEMRFIQKFSLKHHLKKHLLIHSREKTFACNQCDKSNLRPHSLIHSVESYTQKGSLNRYLQTHSKR